MANVHFFTAEVDVNTKMYEEPAYIFQEHTRVVSFYRTRLPLYRRRPIQPTPLD